MTDISYGGNRDIKKLLGNPKITFVLGKSFRVWFDILCRRASLGQGYSVRKVG
jgi:hypothetical protein